MAAIMEFTRYNSAVAGATPVERTFLMPTNQKGTIFIQIAGAPKHKVGDKITYTNSTGRVRFSGTVWYIYKGTSGGVSVHNLYVKHPDANKIGVNTGGTVYAAGTAPKAYDPEAPGSGTGSAADELHAQEADDVLVNENGEVVGAEGEGMPTPTPSMASVLPAGMDIKKVGIWAAIVAVAYFAYKKFGGKK